MTPDLQKEYDAADPKPVLGDAEFERLRALPAAALAALPADRRSAYFATAKHHAEARMGFASADGVDVGGRPIADVLKELRGGQAP